MRSILVRSTLAVSFVAVLSTPGCGDGGDDETGSSGGKKTGVVYALSSDLTFAGQASQGYMFGASFGADDGCTSRKVGPCEVKECPSPYIEPTPD